MSELSDAELVELCDAEWTLETLRVIRLALPRLIARAQKAETDCTDLAGVAYDKGYHEGYRAALRSQEKP